MCFLHYGIFCYATFRLAILCLRSLNLSFSFFISFLLFFEFFEVFCLLFLICVMSVIFNFIILYCKVVSIVYAWSVLKESGFVGFVLRVRVRVS